MLKSIVSNTMATLSADKPVYSWRLFYIKAVLLFVAKICDVTEEQRIVVKLHIKLGKLQFINYEFYRDHVFICGSGVFTMTEKY